MKFLYKLYYYWQSLTSVQDVQCDTWQNTIWSSKNSQMQAHKTMNSATAKCSNATLTTCYQQFGSIQTEITLNISFLRKKAAWSLLEQINFVIKSGVPNKKVRFGYEFWWWWQYLWEKQHNLWEFFKISWYQIDECVSISTLGMYSLYINHICTCTLLYTYI